MKKVIVAMSGGVDSSVAVALLKNRGYDVSGVFMLMHKNSNPHDAKIVAKKLGIDFKILDVRKEFKKRVIDYFIKEYKKGRTPNPCVECNRWIKFKFLFDKMIELNANYIATGHYAKIQNPAYRQAGSKLFVAKDKQKDQSYFLWRLNRKQLDKILFPIGDYTKDEVREMAKQFKLPVFNKKDSQDVCFALPRRLGLRSRSYFGEGGSLRAKAGDIITTDGERIGKHRGLVFYTIGQRKGIEIGGGPASTRQSSLGGPYYVIRKDLKKNALIVSKLEKDLLRKEMIVKDLNWLSGKPHFGKCKVKIRSMAKMVDATIKRNKIIFSKPQRAITPGQSAVFYLRNQIIGGGIII